MKLVVLHDCTKAKGAPFHPNVVPLHNPKPGRTPGYMCVLKGAPAGASVTTVLYQIRGVLAGEIANLSPPHVLNDRAAAAWARGEHRRRSAGQIARPAVNALIPGRRSNRVRLSRP
jgi:hypothetical protein